MLPKWCSFENVKWLLATLMIPITLAYLNHQYQRAQTTREEINQRAQADRQIREARLRLYTELLSKREEADTNLRKGIFDRVLETYLKEAKNPDEKIIALELLSTNFNESLDLSPLFWQILREIQQPGQRENSRMLMERLERVSNDVKDRQIALLEVCGDKGEGNFNIGALSTGANNSFEMEKPIDKDLTFVDPDATDSDKKQTRHFTVFPLEYDQKRHRVFVSVEHRKPNSTPETNSFWLDEFDFPLTNFSRISKSERFALVMRRYDPPNVLLTLIYFPSSRSGVKDKPFIDEVISNLTTRHEKK
jgi:hypothetical protein